MSGWSECSCWGGVLWWVRVAQGDKRYPGPGMDGEAGNKAVRGLRVEGEEAAGGIRPIHLRPAALAAARPRSLFPSPLPSPRPLSFPLSTSPSLP